jgi:hypothetical protein
MDSSETLEYFPAAHSCEFCQLFVLDRCTSIDWGGPEWANHRLRVPQEKITIKPSLRVQEWFDKGKNFRSRDLISDMRAKINHNFTLVFDYTLAEMKHAAEEGCGFSQYLLRDMKTEVPTGKWDIIVLPETESPSRE